MPEYAGLFRKMPVNASGMDLTLNAGIFPTLLLPYVFRGSVEQEPLSGPQSLGIRKVLIVQKHSMGIGEGLFQERVFRGVCVCSDTC